MARSVFRILVAVAVGYLGIIVVLAALQRQMIYLPTRAPAGQLIPAATALGVAPWRDAAGDIIGWRRPPAGPTPEAAAADRGAQARPRLLVFHGNAGFALHRKPFIDTFGEPPGPGWDVVLCEYPGYGGRAGKPSAATLIAAGRAAFDQLRREADAPVFLMGESLGGGVACAVAAAAPDAVAGLILVTPFTSLADVAAHHYPLFPVRWLLVDRYDNRAALRHYRGPVAVVLAQHDEVVPAKLGRRLFDGYAGPKRLWIDRGAGHNSVGWGAGNSFWREVADFLTAPGAGG